MFSENEFSMKPLVYIETTIPSFIYSVRKEPEMVAVRQWTQEWWSAESGFYDLVTSEAVFDELEAGDHPN